MRKKREPAVAIKKEETPAQKYADFLKERTGLEDWKIKEFAGEYSEMITVILDNLKNGENIEKLEYRELIRDNETGGDERALFENTLLYVNLLYLENEISGKGISKEMAKEISMNPKIVDSLFVYLRSSDEQSMQKLAGFADICAEVAGDYAALGRVAGADLVGLADAMFNFVEKITEPQNAVGNK